MIQLLVGLLSFIAVAGFGLIMESVIEAYRWLKAYVQARPRPQAPPHANSEDTDEGDNQCN